MANAIADYHKKLAEIQAMLDARKEEPPKKESQFLDQVQSAIDRRRIFRKRAAALVASPIALAIAPVIGMELYKWWRYVGIDQAIAGVAATLFGAGLMVVAAVFIVAALDKDMHKSW